MARLAFALILSLLSGQQCVAGDFGHSRSDSLMIIVGVRVGGAKNGGFRTTPSTDDSDRNLTLTGVSTSVQRGNGFRFGLGFDRLNGGSNQITADTINYAFQISRLEATYLYFSLGFMGRLDRNLPLDIGAGVDMGLISTRESLRGLGCCYYSSAKERTPAIRPKVSISYILVRSLKLDIECGWLFTDPDKYTYEYLYGWGLSDIGYSADYSGLHVATSVSLSDWIGL